MKFQSTSALDFPMTKPDTAPSIDEYLRERLMPVEGAIPHIPGIEMFGNSIPAETVGGDLLNTSIFNSATTLTHAFGRLNACRKSFLNRFLQELCYAMGSTVTYSG